MITLREIAGELSREAARSLRDAFRPSFLMAFSCACGIFAVFFPLFYSPGTGREPWLTYVWLGGAFVWFVSAFAGVVFNPEERAIYVFTFFAVPITYWLLVSLGVSH